MRVVSSQTVSGACQLETFDDVCSRPSDLYDDDDDDLLPRDKEPEAWSVTVDIRTLKRMNSRDIKRQDHIWGLFLCSNKQASKQEFIKPQHKNITLRRLRQ